MRHPCTLNPPSPCSCCRHTAGRRSGPEDAPPLLLSLPMFHSFRNRMRRASVLSGLLFTAACGVSDIAAPPPAAVPSADAGLISDLGGVLKNTLSTVNVLTRLPLNLLGPSKVDQTIGKAGGVIEMPAHGLRFVVPPGA